jgi:hypothetical protein
MGVDGFIDNRTGSNKVTAHHSPAKGKMQEGTHLLNQSLQERMAWILAFRLLFSFFVSFVRRKAKDTRSAAFNSWIKLMERE